MSTKTTLEKRSRKVFGKFEISDRKPFSQSTHCRVVHFHYKKQNFGQSSNLRKPFSTSKIVETSNGENSTTNIIESELKSVTVTKSLSMSNSSMFELTLHPTRNWKRYLAPGDWLGIYFYDSLEKETEAPTDTKNLILLGNIDRVSRSLQRENETSDKIVLTYRVSGRGSSKVFEDTDIWYDPYVVQSNVVDAGLRNAGLPLQGNPSGLVDAGLNIFLGKGQNTSLGFTEPLKQWRIPPSLARLFGSSTTGEVFFFDILQKQLESNLPGYKVRSMISLNSNGNLLEYLRKHSNSLINELFIEDVRGSDGLVKPTIVLRPKPFNTPFFDSQFGKEKNKIKPVLNGKHTTMQQLSDTSFLEISQSEIIFEDIGRDDHSRMNMFILQTPQETNYLKSIMANLNLKGISNPFILRESIQRHGLKRLEQVQDFIYPQAGVKTPEVDIFKAFITQIYDMNYANHMYESGTIQTTGVLEAELGKALVIQSTKPKVYYIEGYEHSWSFPSTWRTTFTLTHGQFKTSGNRIFIDAIDEDFGASDTPFDSTFLAKTRVKK